MLPLFSHHYCCSAAVMPCEFAHSIIATLMCATYRSLRPKHYKSQSSQFYRMPIAQNGRAQCTNEPSSTNDSNILCRRQCFIDVCFVFCHFSSREYSFAIVEVREKKTTKRTLIIIEHRNRSLVPLDNRRRDSIPLINILFGNLFQNASLLRLFH